MWDLFVCILWLHAVWHFAATVFTRPKAVTAAACPSWRERQQLLEALPPWLVGTTFSARPQQHRLVLASCPWHVVWIAKTLFPSLQGCAAAGSCTASSGSWCSRSAPPQVPPVADQASADYHASASCHGTCIWAWDGSNGPRLAMGPGCGVRLWAITQCRGRCPAGVCCCRCTSTGRRKNQQNGISQWDVYVLSWGGAVERE